MYLFSCFPYYGRFYDLGHNVVGVEGVERGIREFFEESNISFDVSTDESGIPCYKVSSWQTLVILKTSHNHILLHSGYHSYSNFRAKMEG